MDFPSQPTPLPPPVNHQPPTPPRGHELPGARVEPGQPHHCGPKGDPLSWAWPSALGDGSGGSLQWGVP
eukprot:629308-Prorocentrum_lima.AAC.1